MDTVSGKGDQATGIIWRCANKDNYDTCRTNALEDNVVLHQVEKAGQGGSDQVWSDHRKTTAGMV